MAVDDFGIETLKKAAEYVIPGDKSDYYYKVGFADNERLDSFGRLRASLPHPIFNSINSMDKEPEKWSELLVGGGTATLNLNKACVECSVGTASGDKVVRQTKRAFYYITGLSKLHLQTFVFNLGKTNLRQRIGAFDENNGIFLEQIGTQINIVLRSNVSGTPIDNVVPQSQWSNDRLDGTDHSGITLDLTKSHILFIDIQWLGVGRVRVGFVIDGIEITAHTFLHANIVPSVYMRTGKLHLRSEIENLGVTASASTLQHICSSVIVEGNGVMPHGILHSANNGITSRAMTAGNRTVVISIRPVNSEITLLPSNFNLMIISSNDVFYELILSGTITGGTWVSNSTSADKNVTATGITGGTIVTSGYIKSAASAGAIGLPIEQTLFLGHSLDGTLDSISVVATPITGNGSCIGSIDYKEIY